MSRFLFILSMVMAVAIVAGGVSAKKALADGPYIVLPPAAPCFATTTCFSPYRPPYQISCIVAAPCAWSMMPRQYVQCTSYLPNGTWGVVQDFCF